VQARSERLLDCVGESPTFTALRLDPRWPSLLAAMGLR
jgi:hypothetical protein